MTYDAASLGTVINPWPPVFLHNFVVVVLALLLRRVLGKRHVTVFAAVLLGIGIGLLLGPLLRSPNTSSWDGLIGEGFRWAYRLVKYLSIGEFYRFASDKRLSLLFVTIAPTLLAYPAVFGIPKIRLRRLRFSLRTLLLFTAGCAVLLSVWAALNRDETEEERAARELQEAGILVSWNRDDPPRVYSVDFFDVREVDGSAFAAVRSFSSLQRLGLGRTDVTDSHLQLLRGMRGLRWLDLSGTEVSDRGVAHVECLQDLRFLDVSRTSMTDMALEHFAKLPMLQGLMLSETQVSDAGLAHLTPLDDLIGLDLSHAAITDDGLVHLASLPLLRDLHLGGTGITDSGLEHLCKLEDLKALNLSQTKVTDEGLARLLELKKLQRLHLAGTPVTDKGMMHLARLKYLQVLVLDNTAVGDAGLKSLAASTSLEHLYVRNTPVGNAGLLSIVASESLTKLSASGSRITMRASQAVGPDDPDIQMPTREDPARPFFFLGREYSQWGEWVMH